MPRSAGCALVRLISTGAPPTGKSKLARKSDYRSNACCFGSSAR